MRLRCAACNHVLPESSYCGNQFSRGPGFARCATCVHGHHFNLPQTGRLHCGRYNESNQGYIDVDDLEDPFEEGAFRWVARGKYTGGPRKGQPTVIKWFKSGVVFSEDYYTHDIMAVDKALEILDKFNELGIINRQIKINVPEVVTLVAPNSHGEDAWHGTKCLCEPFIQNYEKFNSNSGWNDDSDKWGRVMQAVSHFSYHITGGRYVLCDLQGGIYRREVVLSDPVILSQDRRYGVTDLGSRGITSFFSQHICNEYCWPNWALPADGRRYFNPVRGTTMIQRTVPTDYRRPAGTRFY